MRRLSVFFLLSVALLSLFNWAITAGDWYTAHRAQRAQVSLNFAHSACSGTYVGHNTILTAGHCVMDSETHGPSFRQTSNTSPALYVSINEGRLFQVKKIESDGADHVLLTVDAYSSWYLQIDQSNYFTRDQKVFAIGHPGGRSLPEIKYGTYMGSEFVRNDDMMSPVNIWDLAGQPGDSGEAIINRFGEIVATLSMGDQQNILYSIPFNFTSAQIKGIK